MVKGKQLVQGQQFVFKCKVATSNSYIDTEALTDSGATGNCISTLFAQRHNLPTFRLKQPLQLRLGDGNFAMAPITHGVLAPISHAEHVSEELFYSVPMTTYDFIFGTSWLEEHNPHIDWREKTMRFNSEHCYANCLHKGEQVTVRSSRHRRAAAKAKERNPTYANMDIHHVSGEAAAALASRPENGTIWLYPHDFEQLDKDDSDDADERAQASRVFASLFAMDMNALSQEDIDKFHQKLNSPAKTRDEVLDKLPEWLHDLAHRFNPDPATTDLPARRGAVDHSIDIIPGSKHPNAKMYGISKDEGLAVKAYVEDMRGRGMLYLMSEEAYGVDDLVDDDSTPDVALDSQPKGETIEIPHAAAPASLARVPGENAPDDGLMTAIVNAYRVDPTLQEIIRAKADGARHLPHTVAIQMKLKLELQDCEIRNSLVYFRGRLFIPYDDDLRKDIVRRFHDTATAGHGGKRSTYYLVSQQYYWPLMTDTVAQYTRSCVVCRRAKPYRDRKQGLLHPLPVPKRFWTDISVDFITPLPDCTRFGRTYSHVMVVIDRLSKSQRFIALDSLEVDAVVRAFVDYVWREEGFPTTIVSDRGSQFVSHFWKELCHRLGVTPKLSTAYHPETDGQTEVANAGLKCYLRAYTNYMQNDWVDWLPLAQLAINNRENVSSGVAPALATKGYLPRMGSELVTEDSPITDARSRAEQLLREDARGTVKRMTDVIRFMQENLRWSQNKMEHYANQHRQPAPDYRVGDKVYIDARNIPTMRPSRGLSAKNLGPYKVRALPNRYAVELALPDCYKQVHPVFHPWLLHLDADQTARPSEGVIAEKHPDGEHDYYVDMVVDCRIDKRRKDTLTNKKGMLQYKVKYTNSPDWNASPAWQDYTDLWGAEEAVEDFHRLYPDKPPPHELYRDLALYLNLVAAYSLGRDDVEVASVLDSCELALSPSHSLMAQLGPGKVAQLRTSVSKQKQGPEG
ncbi:rve multi-domain protein [Pyrenophora tritici-repentis]|uniref:Rve multi-domain protein n=1 Tax=Pyrenophora tritici-repentis TaxID=45151 RepID=A0A922N929_9PLEO|nr:rve multi-domain protein [Pyrenophora tritici-repentis]